MVKRLIKNTENQEDELSDLEIDADIEENKIIINEEERLLYHKDKINNEFIKLFNAKGKNPGWLESLTVTSKDLIDSSLNVDDDIKRELLFYNLTSSNTMMALRFLREVIYF